MEHLSSEQEQIDQLKRWWKENGKSLVLGLVLGIGGLAGYRYWDASETAKAQSASQNYELFLQLATEQRTDDARTTGTAIIENYAGSTYARLSALLLAKIEVESGNVDVAKVLLETLVTSKDDSEIDVIARTRLARIALSAGDTAAANTWLSQIPTNDDNTRFAELRADVMSAEGDKNGARTMYLQALAQAQSLGLERGAIQLKLDNLGQSSASD